MFIIVSFLKTVSIHTHISYNGTVCIITSYFFVFNLTFVPQNLVIRTKSVEYMPFYLSLSTFLMSTAFFLYGIFNFDPFVYVSFFVISSCVFIYSSSMPRVQNSTLVDALVYFLMLLYQLCCQIFRFQTG